MHFSPSSLLFLALAAGSAQAFAVYPRADNATSEFHFSNNTDTAMHRNSTRVALNGKPVFQVDVCDNAAEPNCETQEVTSMECRVLTTTLGPVVGNETVYHPAKCFFVASSDCTAFGDMTQSLIGGIGMTGDSGTADVQQVVRGKILSMVYMPDE